jgi:hypothetical protein
MTVEISINESSPKFTGLDMKHVSLVIGSVSQSPMFYNFKRAKGAVGNAGTNNKMVTVSKAHPLVFEDHDFALIATTKDPFYASRTLSPLIDYMRKDLIIVKKDGVALTPEEVHTFTP